MSVSPERRSEIMLTNIATSDCGVIALQAITGLKREAAEKLMSKNGYSPVTGTPRGSIERSLQSKGWQVRRVLPDVSDTPATFSLCHEYGRYLLYTDGHVMALVDGDLHNSRGHWRLPIEEIMEVTK